MTVKKAEIGMVGLGVMGCNLVLNMADHGFSVAGFDRDPEKGSALSKQTGSKPILVAKSLNELVDSLEPPRAIVMMVPAGPPVDAVIHDMLPLLASGDILIDGGNSYYKDTDLRASALAEHGIQFLGTGISGGEEGARHGPSMMPGGTLKAYQRVRPIFEAIAAHVGETPCVTYLGKGSAGHFVKMVHNGIEYGLMELIAETYDLMKRGFGLTDDDLVGVYRIWNKGPLASFLLEITGEIFSQDDERTGRRLVDVILDEAGQKGTGKWTSQEAMDLQVPTPTIDLAVAIRELSVLKKNREAAAQIYRPAVPVQTNSDRSALQQLPDALYTAFIITFAQGFSVLQEGSKAHDYALKLDDIARIWRGGCIIRASLLDHIVTAYQDQPDLSNLILDERFFRKEIMGKVETLRQAVTLYTRLGIPAPGLMASLSYFDAYTSGWLPANLIQAQRDFFGAHSYERIDDKGIFHTHWGHE